MGYAGIDEFISETGVYWTNPTPYLSYTEDPKNQFGEVPKWENTITVTNGYDATDPDCCAAPKLLVKENEDFWCVDPYGTRYAVRYRRYEPNSPRWQLYKPVDTV